MYDEYKNHDVAIYGGYVVEREKLLESASGGIATAIAERMIEKGGYVAGVAYSEDFRCAEYILVHDKESLVKLKGSKYIETNKKSIFSDVKNLLEQGKEVLFIGLPCIVAALYKFVGVRPENLLTCELVCHGPMEQKVHDEYIGYLENKYRGKLIDFSTRHKKNEWMTSYLYAKFSNGRIFEKPFYETEYGIAFSILGRASCYQCQFKGNNRQGDIMVGDFWGAKEGDEYWNRYGVSSVFVETLKGKNFLLEIPNIKLFPTNFEKAVIENPMVIVSKTKDERREKFLEMLSEKGLMYAASHLFTPMEKFMKKVNKMMIVLYKMIRVRN